MIQKLNFLKFFFEFKELLKKLNFKYSNKKILKYLKYKKKIIFYFFWLNVKNQKKKRKKNWYKAVIVLKIFLKNFLNSNCFKSVKYENQ